MTNTSTTTVRRVPAEVPQPATATATTRFADAGLRQHLQRMRQSEQAERDRRAELQRRRELARLD